MYFYFYIKNQDINLKPFGAVYLNSKTKNYILSEKEIKDHNLKLISKAIFHNTLNSKG